MDDDTTYTRVAASAKMGDHLSDAIYYEARGIQYEVEWFDTSDRGYMSVVIEAYNAKGNRIWRGPTSCTADDRIVDVVRNAKDNS